MVRVPFLTWLLTWKIRAFRLDKRHPVAEPSSLFSPRGSTVVYQPSKTMKKKEVIYRVPQFWTTTFGMIPINYETAAKVVEEWKSPSPDPDLWSNLEAGQRENVCVENTHYGHGWMDGWISFCVWWHFFPPPRQPTNIYKIRNLLLYQ